MASQWIYDPNVMMGRYYDPLTMEVQSDWTPTDPALNTYSSSLYPSQPSGVATFLGGGLPTGGTQQNYENFATKLLAAGGTTQDLAQMQTAIGSPLAGGAIERPNYDWIAQLGSVPGFYEMFAQMTPEQKTALYEQINQQRIEAGDNPLFDLGELGSSLLQGLTSPGVLLALGGMGLGTLGTSLAGGGALGGAAGALGADALEASALTGSGLGGLAGGAGLPGGIAGLAGGAGALTGAGNMFGDPIEALIAGTNQGLSGSDLMGFVESAFPGATQGGLEFLLNNPSQLLSGLGGGAGGSNPLGALTSLLGGGGGGAASGLTGTGSSSILGALLGGLLGSTNGSQQAGTTTITNAPWGPQQPYLLSGFGQAQNLLGQQQAYGNPLLDPATQQMQATIQGDYLNPETNPYLSQTVDAALAKAASGVNSQFGTGENYGGSAHQEWLGRTLADTALPYYFGNYNTERGRQATAAAGAPAFTQGLLGAQAAPLQNYMNFVGQGYGTSTTAPYYTNPLLGGISGALAGSQLGGLFGLG